MLTHRVAHLLAAAGAEPNEILAITFTNKAAGEMKERVERMLGPVARAIWILTFHSACGRILRREAERLGYRSNFSIYDQADQVRLVKACLEELERDPKRFVPRGIHSQISNAKNQLIGPTTTRRGSQASTTRPSPTCTPLYQRRLFASNAVDFDDMLMLTVDVLQRFPEARERWAKTFRYILVDEYQDTNHAQYTLLKLLGGETRTSWPLATLTSASLRRHSSPWVTGRATDQRDPGGRRSAVLLWERCVPRLSRRARPPLDQPRGVRITTESGRVIISTPEHMHFAGFKVGRTPQLHMTYLMWKHGTGFRVGTSRTYTNGQVKSVAGPSIRLNGEHADAAWVVGVHDDPAEARLSEALLSLKYPLPTVPFVARPMTKARPAINGLVGDQALLDRLFDEIETRAGARELLNDQGLSFLHPHFTSATTTHGARTRRRVTVTLCGDPRSKSTMHRISLFGYDDEGRRALESIGLSLRPAYKGSPGWRFETGNSDIGKIAEIVDRIRDVLEVSVRYTARLAAPNGGQSKDSNSLPFMPASSVRPGWSCSATTGLRRRRANRRGPT